MLQATFPFGPQNTNSCGLFGIIPELPDLSTRFISLILCVVSVMYHGFYAV